MFTVLFSAINVATQGYILQTIYTTKANETLSQQQWFNKAPWSWGSKFKTSCQAQNLAIGTPFFTTNQGLLYTITSISQFDQLNNQTIEFPSLSYLNNTLSNCTIDQVQVKVRKVDNSLNGGGMWWSWGDSTGSADARCTIDTSFGPMNMSFTTNYKGGIRSYDEMISTNATRAASLWWGSRLLNLYWSAILDQMAHNAWWLTDNNTFSTTPSWMKGQFTFIPNNTKDITSYQYFDMQYYVIASDGNIKNVPYRLSSMYNNRNFMLSGPMTESLTWSKVMASTILTDLGQANTSNILLDSNLIQWALQYPNDTIRTAMNAKSCNIANNETCDRDWVNFGALSPPDQPPRISSGLLVPMNVSYEQFKSKMGPLGTKDAQIFNQYVCSVPVLKSGGSLFSSVLVADLVFLSVLWTLTTWIATNFVRSKNSLAMACESHSYDGQLSGLPLLGINEQRGQQKQIPSPRTSEYDPGDLGRQTTAYEPLNR